jgi:hypothetical protein
MRFEASATSIIVAAAATPIVAIRCPATERMAIREIGVTLQAATLTRLGLVRATVVSVTPTGNFAGQNKNPGSPASGSTLVTGWTTIPTAAGVPFRRITIPAAIGAGYVWTWPADDPLYVGLGSAIAEICINNLVAVAPSLFDFWVVWED